jgi:hypothetical protein
MDSQEDPEQRIQNLERPLADAARASEMGVTQPPGGYGYPLGPPGPPGAPPPVQPPWGAPPQGPPPMGPPPQAPWTYGGPLSGPPPKPPSGNRTWWIVGALIVVIFLVLAGGIAFFVAHKISDARSTINSAISATSSPPRSTSRSQAPSTRTRTPAPSTSSAPSTSPAPPPGGSLTISGIGENKTVACNDNIVTVSGISNTVTITGHCTSLTVSGMQNTITVDAADNIEASGFNNKVTYHTGNPKISNFGGSNVVQQG